MSAAAPFVAVVGWSGSGKTTFLTQVVSELTARGMRVGLVKHHGHGGSIDVEGKDTWSYAQSGACPVVVSSPTEYSVMRQVERERTLAELLDEIADECDLVLVEGYRNQVASGVEFRRVGHRSDPILAPAALLALVCDDEVQRHAALSGGAAATFDLDDVGGFANFLESVARGEHEGSHLL